MEVHKDVILFAEDHEAYKSLMQSISESIKEKIMIANDGAMALQFLNDFNIKLVISTWKLPNIDGLQLLKYIRESNQSKVKFIFLDDKLSDEDVDKALKSGANDVWNKNESPKLIARRIQNILSGHLDYFSPTEILEALPGVTIVIDRDYKIVDFYKSKNFAMGCLSGIRKHKCVLDYFAGMPELLSIKKQIDSTLKDRTSGIIKHMCINCGRYDNCELNGRYESRILPLNGKFAVMLITSISGKRKELLDEVDILITKIQGGMGDRKNTDKF